MERVGKILVLMFTFQLSYATSRSGETLGHIKCNCPPVGGGVGGGIGGGIGSPPVRTDPGYSSPPPAGGSTPSIPSLTPPYSATPSPNTPRSTPPHSPPAPSYIAPPSPSGRGSSSPTTPSVPSYGGSPPSPSSSPPSVPSYGTPPVPPSSSSPAPPLVGTSPSPPDPGVPSTPRGSTPSVPGFPPVGIIPGLPGSGTGTCNFWGSHPSLFPNIPSIFSCIPDLFGSGSLFPSKLGKGLTVQAALTNKRRDGYGLLLREGTASLLNSFVNPAFEMAPHQVKNHFNAALHSNRAAAVQGAKFKSANEGRFH